MKKTYCTDCRYFYTNAFTFFDEEVYCDHPSNMQEVSTPLSKLITPVESYLDINRNNNCKNFRPTLVSSIIEFANKFWGKV